MARSANDIIKKLSPAQRKKVEARAAQLIAEEITLWEARKVRKPTFQRISSFSSGKTKAHLE
jgi:hypothetical protein